MIRERITPENDSGRIVGFVHFRFSVEGDVVDRMTGAPCMFVWDVHLDPSVQRKGLGKHIMTVLELISRREKMHMICIPVQLGDEITGAWVSTLKGYGRDVAMKNVIDFDPDVEGFAVYAKLLVAPKPAPEAAVPEVSATATTPVKGKVEFVADKPSPQSVFDFAVASASNATAAVTDESRYDDLCGDDSADDAKDQDHEECDDEENEEEDNDELDLATIDVHDAMHGLKVMFREKFGHSPSEEIMNQWLENLQQVQAAEPAVSCQSIRFDS